MSMRNSASMFGTPSARGLPRIATVDSLPIPGSVSSRLAPVRNLTVDRGQQTEYVLWMKAMGTMQADALEFQTSRGHYPEVQKNETGDRRWSLALRQGSLRRLVSFVDVCARFAFSSMLKLHNKSAERSNTGCRATNKDMAYKLIFSLVKSGFR